MFGDLLKELRMQRNVTQIELARAIGVSNGNVGDWERGRSKPGYDALAALSRYFEISPEHLLELDASFPKASDDCLSDSATSLLQDNLLSDEEASLIAMYRLLPCYAREDMFDQVHCLYRKYADRKKESIYWTYKEDKGGKSAPVEDRKVEDGTA